MKLESSKLPSKAERDFWNAFLLQGEPEHHGRGIESQSVSSESYENPSAIDKPFVLDTNQIEKSKSSIQNMTESAKEIKLEYDLKVEKLFFKRLYCDYIIHFLELKISCALLYTLAEQEFSKSREETEEELETVTGFVDEFDSLLKEAKDLEKQLRQLHSKIQKQERSVSSKIETKCSKVVDSEKTFDSFRRLPSFPLQSENPFWTPSLILTAEDLSVAEKSTAELCCPENVDASLWKTICSKRVRHLKLCITLRHLQFQIMTITKVTTRSLVIKLKLKTKQEYCRRIIESIKQMFTKCRRQKVTLGNGERKHQEESGSSRETAGGPRLAAEFLCPPIEIKSKLDKCRLKHVEHLGGLREELNKQMAAFQDTKALVEEAVDEKWKILKFLSS
ncbi:cilia- and flagella-associated protein 43 [Caerostris extrusa]|uniref:Cilia- and flagella-associated protein 43 n=1 Tax=Caerostris extrusa TaxID=172846 RepID=A0AAV4XHP6_CAEEX|nr:cilia- and flagella-associated protein 43 [Caerostris extrusa]